MAKHISTREKHLELGLAITTGLITGMEGAHFFSSRLPSAMTTRKFADRPEDLQALQQGIMEATVLSIGTAGAISGIYKWARIKYWWIPLMTNIFITATMATLYWNDIQSARLNGNLKNIQYPQ
jgi:hypothetical protein